MLKKIFVPDIGAFSNVSVIEILVAPGDTIELDAALITLETDKAIMEIPSPAAGIIQSLELKVGDKVSEGSLILILESSEAETSAPAPAETQASAKPEASQPETAKVQPATPPTPPATPVMPAAQNNNTQTTGSVHAGPGVRRFARELGVNLSLVSGTGPKHRILKSDVQSYVKAELTRIQNQPAGASLGGLSIAPWPSVDHSKFGRIKTLELSRIKKISGSYLHRNWVSVPHVTQFDEADITELERFRKENQTLAEHQKVKLTPLAFIMKAVVSTLKQFPNFNASLDANGSQLILKEYFHIGVAVDTPNGLVVPVVRDVDQKGLFQLAKELAEISQKAREGQLTAADMQGSSFSISSLGGVGGTAFTPIINVPDVAILGVSKAQIKPIFIDQEFKPRLMLPLSLSYDHRVIDGAEAARFTNALVAQLSDIRRLLL